MQPWQWGLKLESSGLDTADMNQQRIRRDYWDQTTVLRNWQRNNSGHQRYATAYYALHGYIKNAVFPQAAGLKQSF